MNAPSPIDLLFGGMEKLGPGSDADTRHVLGPRAKSMLDHADPSVREFAAGMIREIEVFELSENGYGCMFYVLKR
jgi:hypothetical protein